jgi:phosphatidylethanolamine-binding protein (PEBP) family uncharacterized protein
LVAVVIGCGGGGSSTAPGTTSAASPTPAPSGSPPAADQQNSTPAADADGAGEPGKDAKKHPPLKLPAGKPEQGFTKAQRERAPTADIAMALPDGLTTANTCKGANISPAVTWRHLPPGVSELAIFAMSVKPVDGKLKFDWAMAGIDPDLTGLKPGEVPKGAVLGRSSDGHAGYSICPEGSKAETYIFALYAVEGGLEPKPGFDPLALRKRATRASDKAGLTAATAGG